MPVEVFGFAFRYLCDACLDCARSAVLKSLGSGPSKGLSGETSRESELSNFVIWEALTEDLRVAEALTDQSHRSR